MMTSQASTVRHHGEVNRPLLGLARQLSQAPA